MFERRSLRLPITLAVIMIVLLILILIGWVIVNAFAARSNDQQAGFYWAFLSIGVTLLGVVLVGVVFYMVLTIKAINLSQRQSNFIDAVTHELKSPIASLKLYLQTLHRRPVPVQEQADFFRYMLADVERLDDLINQLLDAARLDKVAKKVEKEWINLADVVRSCAEVVRKRYELGPEQVELNLRPVLVFATQVDLEVIVRNLLDNAVKYGGEVPQVDVVLEPKSDEQVVLRVTDNGLGIPVHQRWRVFARFVRLGSELERAKPGTGLGLYLVRTLVDRMKGRVRIRDREGGCGTTFEVILPGKLQPQSAEAQSFPKTPN